MWDAIISIVLNEISRRVGDPLAELHIKNFWKHSVQPEIKKAMLQKSKKLKALVNAKPKVSKIYFNAKLELKAQAFLAAPVDYQFKDVKVLTYYYSQKPGRKQQLLWPPGETQELDISIKLTQKEIDNILQEATRKGLLSRS